MKFENLLPFFAPAPAGVVIGIRLYAEIMTAIGGTPSIIWQIIAFAAAFVGCMAMILAEMYSYKQAALALAEQEIGAAVLAFVLSLVCSGLIVYAVYTSEDSRPLISAVAIAIIAYAVTAIKDFRARKNQKKAQVYAQSVAETSKETQNEAAQREYELKMAEIELAKERARARALKNATANEQIQPFSERSVNKETPKEYHYDAEKLAQATRYMAEHRDASGNELARAFGWAQKTGQVYKQAVADGAK
jgi:hypothetical protein